MIIELYDFGNGITKMPVPGTSEYVSYVYVIKDGKMYYCSFDPESVSLQEACEKLEESLELK